MTKKDALYWYGFFVLIVFIGTGFLNWFALTWLLGKQPAWYVFIWTWMIFLSIVKLQTGNK